MSPKKFFFKNWKKGNRKNFLVKSIHDFHLGRLEYLKGSLIDIGCGEKPYKEIVKPYVNEHIGVDHEETLHEKSNIDLVGTAYNIPVEDGRFDSALCTAVLEHLEDPERAIKECHRILKTGGIAIYSVPFIWHIHERPRDFYRFSNYGLRYLFDKVGFEVIEIKALSGFWVTFGQLFVYYIYRFNRGVIRWLKIVEFFGFFVQYISYHLDRLDFRDDYTWMYMVVARKK